jgi:hypothetical protein
LYGRRLQSAIENLKTCPERAKRVEWIGNIVVPVVQRIERRFPKGKTPLLHEFAHAISSAQIAAKQCVEELSHSPRVISNLPIFTTRATQRVTQLFTRPNELLAVTKIAFHKIGAAQRSLPSFFLDESLRCRKNTRAAAFMA